MQRKGIFLLEENKLTLGAAIGLSLKTCCGGNHLGLLLQQRDVVTEEDDLLASHDQVPHVADQHHGDEGLPAAGPEVHNYILPLGLLQQLNLDNRVI